jgi:DNA adenine methylase
MNEVPLDALRTGQSGDTLYAKSDSLSGGRPCSKIIVALKMKVVTVSKIPQPIPYQGSKRLIAPQILNYVPQNVGTLFEPFAGSAALSVRAALEGKASHFYLSDANAPLMHLLQAIIEHPDTIADEYERLWNAQRGRERVFYDEVRSQFNRAPQPADFLYLLARCVKASVRYNAKGEFNQSPDNRRRGRTPKSMRSEIYQFSRLLHGKVTVTSKDYTTVLAHINPATDFVYLDPPYQGTSTKKDSRYYDGLHRDELIVFLEALNDRNIRYLLSYDGRRGTKQYGLALPLHLGLLHTEICAGRSTQATLLGKKDNTYESLYISPALLTQASTFYPLQLELQLEIA